MQTLGRHAIIDFYECDAKIIDDVDDVRAALIHAANLTGATIITDAFHKFSPQGVSGVVVIAESHFAIHTWPEHNCALIDVLTCSEKMDVVKAKDYLRLAFRSKRVEYQELKRGQVPAQRKPAVGEG